jgi:hypothetical protein
MGMDSDQCLLQEVLRLRRTMTDSCAVVPVVGAQVRCEPFQKLVVRSRVSVEARCHEGPKLEFVKMSEFVHLFAVGAV